MGMIGGGQLARMTHQAAIALGVGFRVLAAHPDDSAAQVVADVQIGRHDDPEAVTSFAEGCDVITFDHEHVPEAILSELEAAGVAVRPGLSALRHAQDKLVMRQALSEMGAPVPAWAEVANPDDVADFAIVNSWPVVLKTSRGGYDGRGVWIVRDRAEAVEVMAHPLSAPGARWLVEQYMPFHQELAAQVARSPHGQSVAYPVVRTTQIDGICTEVVAPCPDLPAPEATRAQEVALRALGGKLVEYWPATQDRWAVVYRR